MPRGRDERHTPGFADGFLDAVGDRVGPYGPVLLVAAILSGAGWLVETTVGFAGALGEARLFFQLVLAGALMSVLRNEIGLRTYGLFAPVVIAFIMTGAGPVWGLVLFVNVLVVTLTCHQALSPLKLGTAPRVAVLLSVASVATAMAFAAARAGELPVEFGSGRVFFPTIVTAWYADRAATEIEERGWRQPARRLLGTLLAVVLCYVVVVTEPLVDWFVTTPVAWGVLLVTIAFLGSRPGFRVSEHLRFAGHYDGSLGPVSVATTRLRSRLGGLVRRLTEALGREVDPAPSTTEVLGMKRRNRYIETYNPPHVRPAADEKAAVNRRLSGLDVESPRTYAVCETPDDVDAAVRVVDARDEFVIKPSKGYGGEGIVVVSGCDGDRYDTSKGPMTAAELRGHLRRIVDGQYSGLDDDGTAIVEEKLTPAGFMRGLHGDGVADVRVIVFQGYPVMAMTRLPTEESDGAANLHLGAVGVGLSIADGTPLSAYQQSRGRELDTHPDTGASLTDFRTPNWDGVLETAVKAAAVSGLGYTGVDVVLAEGNVPKVLEVNVRPGLGIQNTTGEGIFRRLEFVEALSGPYEFFPPERKVERAREWADGDWSRDLLLGEDTPDPSETRGGHDVCPDQTPTTVTDGRGTVVATDEDIGRPTGTDTHAKATDGTGDTDGKVDALDTATTDAGTGRRSLYRALQAVGGVVASVALFAGAWAAGVPVLAAATVLNAVGFVVWLCGKALGVGDDYNEGVTTT
jgi:alpha-L-glutamate ligase-like protein